MSILNPVRVVKLENLDALKNAATAPLEELGEIRTDLLKIRPVSLDSPFMKNRSGLLSGDQIQQAIASLKDCQRERTRLWVIERKTLMRLHDAKAHEHPSVNLPSFQQFLSKHFEKNIAYLYLKEVASGKKEQLLGLPVGTYSLHQFKILERFRCFVSVGTLHPGEGLKAGVKPNPQGIAHLRECWAIACEEAGGNRPTSKDIEKAVRVMGERYPNEYAKQKETSSVRKWKERAILAENRVQELEAMLAQLTTGANK
jgi:hypothetical protein